ncbi:MAG: MarR family transcriptional regulator [Methanomassiliicoccaceae archaeon]|jgi:DNA-binding MarR family transcriptional regulator|nr:MarR family transcriptional regulator [Methanomassiliicoccaceae archaeon]
MYYDEYAKEILQHMASIQREQYQRLIVETTQGAVSVLQFIKNIEGEIIPGQISEKLGISTARVAVILNNLENKGLITRDIDTKDRRKIIVTLTQDGMDLVEEKQKDNIELLKGLLIQLGEDDTKELSRIMGKFAKIQLSEK